MSVGTSARRRVLPTRRPHIAMSFYYAGIKHSLGVGFYDHAETEVAEVFIDTHKQGTALGANAKDAAVLMSLALQHGASLATIDSALNRADPPKGSTEPGEPAGAVGAAMDRLREERPDLFEAVEPYAEEVEPVAAMFERQIEALVATQSHDTGPIAMSDEDKLACTLAALRTLKRLGYAWDGGETWKGPIDLREVHEARIDTAPIDTDTKGRLEEIARKLGVPVSSFFKLEPGIVIEEPIAWTRCKLAGALEENANLHDQVAALSDELQRLRDQIHHGLPPLDVAHHVKRQKSSDVLTFDATLQTDNSFGLRDCLPMTVYFHDDGAVYVRSTKEMRDGRFTFDGSIGRHLVPMELRSMRQARGIDLAASIWGAEAVWNPAERLRRFFEEACELVQALDMPAEEARRIKDGVFARPKGEPEQEIGGVSFCLLALCASHGLDADELEVREIRRVMAKDPNVMRRRHQQKVEAGLAMQAQLPDDVREVAQ